MKFTDLPALSLFPGRLTVWRCAPRMREATWVADPRRASHVQEAHITHALEMAAGGSLLPSWLGSVFGLPAQLDAHAFTTALRQWTDRHEILRSHLTFSPGTKSGGHLQRRTLPPGAVSIHPSAAGDFTDGRQLARYLEELFNGEISPLGWPAYMCVTIDRPEATTVCLAADHVLMDGYSILATAHEIQTLYAAALAARGGKPAPPLLPPTASYVDFAEAERTEADALTVDHESIVSWRHFLAEADGRLPEFPVPVGDVSGNAAAQPSRYVQLLDASAAQAFAQHCREPGGNILSGLLACLAKVGYEISGSGEFRTMVPFHKRTGPWRSSIGWYVGMGPVAFPFSKTDSFPEAVCRAVSSVDQAKELARVPIPRVADLLGQPLRDPFMVSYMDLRRTPGARSWKAWQVIALRSRSTDPDEVCLWVVRTYDGLVVNYRHPATGLAAVAVPDYVARARHVLACVANTGCWPAILEPAGEYCA
ncbi:condensation domain-containing protein [Ensifer aridi]|uniref:condensation domain-containing protein n=1 Tax=Ensifer aridi TaxID=1708715 RepID=UPI001AECD178|nr:condensation domain-containing protein [Ensifer aridi]